MNNVSIKFLAYITIFLASNIHCAILAQTITPTNNISEQILDDETPTPNTTPTPTPTPIISRNILEQFIIHKNNLTGRVAFSVKINEQYHIFLLDLDANKISPLIVSKHNNFYPAWSPNGKLLAFTSDRDGDNEIFIADWEGNNLQQLTFNNTGDGNPSWHPNGQDIFFYRETKNKRTANIYKINIQSKNTTQITKTKGRNTTPKVSKKGDMVAYSTNRYWPGWDICLFNFQTRMEDCILKGVSTFCRPDWGPKDQKIAYSFGVGKEINIGVKKFLKGQVIEVTKMPGREYDATYSADGKIIIFTAENGNEGIYNLYYTSKSYEEKKLLSAPFSMRYISWSPITTLQLEAERIKTLEQ